MIKAYHIVTARTMQELQDKVNAKIQENWQPMGGPMQRDHPSDFIAQAMVQESPPAASWSGPR